MCVSVLRCLWLNATLAEYSTNRMQAEERREQEEGLRLYWDRSFGHDWVQVQCKEVRKLSCVSLRGEKRLSCLCMGTCACRAMLRLLLHGRFDMHMPMLSHPLLLPLVHPSHTHTRAPLRTTQVSFRLGEVEPLWCTLALFWLDYRIEKQHQVRP